ncbi:hypothetical protein B0F90DRAFT_1819101 [Multifurca ochricompacta]|uniref:Uncharacterized protein n=1 Tax=Multifurca ochricompacta TaxID=376703 RepID=A0AAD4QLZ2_9AGAM|nr:hypothetical protein B0F90DRAFT_1819101 [Multifurca ochricompacta]
MATKTQTTPSAFSRIRSGFGHKLSRSHIPPEPPEIATGDDWYMPYNGPYELPPTVPRTQNRDSWGQLLGSVLNNLGGSSVKLSDGQGQERLDGRVTGGRINYALPNSGAYSSHPYRMNAASDASDAPGMSILGSQRRRTVSHSHSLRGGDRPALITTTSTTAFANTDTTGGVGESPRPAQRSPLYPSSPTGASSRLSFAGLLTFGSSTRKSRPDSTHAAARQRSGKRSRINTSTSDPLQLNRATVLNSQSQFFLPRSHSPVHHGPPTTTEAEAEAEEFGHHQHHGHRIRRRFHTLIGTSMAPAARSLSHHDPSITPFNHRESPISTHPYAYTYPSSHTEPPRRAPIVPPASHYLDKGKGVDRSYQYPQPPAPDTLNNSSEVPPHLKPASRSSLLKTISAPNLRNFSRSLPTSKSTSSRGKYRWLSPETWCDALLFPRPRFTEHTDDEPQQLPNHRYIPVIQPPGPSTGRERLKLSQAWMRGSRSVVNLRAPNSESSCGPPLAEPWLMPPKGSIDGDGHSSSGRPRSFAQDDLSLPSPGPSLAKVLEMGASFERERAAWKAQAARSLQASRLTRSLGRSRSQSVGRTRAQLKDSGGVGFLTTKTLLGNQFAAPTVHTPPSSDGTQTLQTRSGTSHARTLSSGGHSRAGSKSKAALRAAAGLCISDGKMSPQDEHGNTFPLHDGGGRGTRIVEANAPNSGGGSSPSPLVTNGAAVGIALSTPPSSTEDDGAGSQRLPYMQNHPYAQGTFPPSRRSHGRSSSDYAGPHPSLVSVPASAAALASDVSARHRLPPQASLHPYASTLAYPHASSSQRTSTAPAVSMLARGSHQSSSLENYAQTPPRPAPQRPAPPQPQLWETTEPGRSGPHAYASGNRFSGEPLFFADALSYGLQRRGSADSGLGDSESHYEPPSSAAQLLIPFPHLALTTTPERRRPDFTQGSSTFMSLRSNRTVASSPSEALNPPVFSASLMAHSAHSAQASSADEHLPGSRASSPQQSPHPLSSIEDLDRYRNLFYRPMASCTSRTPSGEHRRGLSRDTGSLIGIDIGTSGRISAGSGLAALTRQLSSEFGAMQDVRDTRPSDVASRRPLESPTRMWGLRYGGLRGDGAGSRTDPNVVLSNQSDSDMNSRNANSPDDATPTLSPHHRSLGRKQSNGSLMIHVSHDVESHTSSVLDRSELDDVDHDELLRVGTIEAISSTPVATAPTHRLSFMGDIHGGRSQDSLSLAISAAAGSSSLSDEEERSTLPPLRISPFRSSVTSSGGGDGDGLGLLPPALPSARTDMTRSSYMTNETATTSRISGLSDFPIPPNQTIVSSDRVELLKSYFGGAQTQTHTASTGGGSGVGVGGGRPGRPVIIVPSSPTSSSRIDGHPRNAVATTSTATEIPISHQPRHRKQYSYSGRVSESKPIISRIERAS